MRRDFQFDTGSVGSCFGSEVELGGEAGEARPILAVIVCYEPGPQALSLLVENLVRQPDVRVLLVDNSELDSGRVATASAAARFGAELVANDVNVGVAAAHNIGVLRALESGAKFVLLLDQDSELDVDTVARLADAHRALTAAGQSVAAVGPSFSDPRGNRTSPFVRLRNIRMEAVVPADGQVVECDILISSGCFISLEALRQIGGMDERLFIDFVDIEWCLRAHAAGWKVFGVADAHMHHTIGNRALKVFGRVIPVHSPTRNYYLIRNAFLLARKPYLDWRWRAHLMYRVVGQFLLFGLLCPQRLQRIAWMLKGLWDGLLGRDGRLFGDSGNATREARGQSTARPVANAPVESAAIQLND